jgi:hypothetical protein
MDRLMTIGWWQWLPIHRWRIIGTVQSADEIPEKLPKRAAIVVGTGNFPKWIAFDCPCRSGHRVMLNTDRGRRPAWTLKTSGTGGLSIFPSIDFIEGDRRCHFIVRAGRIVWVQDALQ